MAWLYLYLLRILITASRYGVEGEVPDYESILIMELSEGIKENLRSTDVSDSVIIGLTTVEATSLIPGKTTDRFRRTKAFLFLTH